MYTYEYMPQNSFTYTKIYDTSGVRYVTYIKSTKFWSQVEASCMSSHTEELRYNGTVCLWRTNIYVYIYIYIYIYIYFILWTQKHENDINTKQKLFLNAQKKQTIWLVSWILIIQNISFISI